jgi:hypothetical protein
VLPCASTKINAALNAVSMLQHEQAYKHELFSFEEKKEKEEK